MYAILFNKPEERKVVTKNNNFLPGRTSFVFDISSSKIVQPPTVIQRSDTKESNLIFEKEKEQILKALTNVINPPKITKVIFENADSTKKVEIEDDENIFSDGETDQMDISDNKSLNEKKDTKSYFSFAQSKPIEEEEVAPTISLSKFQKTIENLEKEEQLRIDEKIQKLNAKNQSDDYGIYPPMSISIAEEKEMRKEQELYESSLGGQRFAGEEFKKDSSTQRKKKEKKRINRQRFKKKRISKTEF